MDTKKLQKPQVYQKEKNARSNMIESKGKTGRGEEKGENEEGKEGKWEIPYLLSSVNKPTCAHTDELGRLDNKDPNIELL